MPIAVAIVGVVAAGASAYSSVKTAKANSKAGKANAAAQTAAQKLAEEEAAQSAELELAQVNLQRQALIAQENSAAENRKLILPIAGVALLGIGATAYVVLKRKRKR